MRFLTLILFSIMMHAAAATQVINVYIWGGEIPKQVIDQFEKETGIKVNFSTYDSNETLYAKLRASKKTIYDVILPSSYFVERMQKQGMLTRIDKTKISNLQNLDPFFANHDYDANNQFSLPLVWGTTGLFYNRGHINHSLTTWNQLWSKDYNNKLLLLDDSREIFAIALMSLGYSPNDESKQHIAEAYQKLLSLIPNIKLFSSEGIQAILIDEDSFAGVVWNGDAYKAQNENKLIEFTLPPEGYVIWVDCLAIPAHAPHLKEAYTFINFLFRSDIAASIGLIQGNAITNQAGRALLPLEIQNNTIIYPSTETLSHGHFQKHPDEQTLALYNQYWQQLKLAF